MDDDRYRTAANRIIESIADREKTDIKLQPSLVSLVIAIYLAVTIYYVTSVYSRYEIIPIQQMFTVAALFTIGGALVISIMLSLSTRNRKHAEREGRLRSALIDYCIANDHSCGYDLSANIERMKDKDEELNRMYDGLVSGPSLFLIAVPIVVSLVLIMLPALKDHAIGIMSVCYGIAMCISLFVTPVITTFPRRHEMLSEEYYHEFEEISGYLGMDGLRYETTIGYRSFWMFILFTVLSLGLFLIYWAYLMFKDMNGHFDMQWAYEDRIFRSVRGREMDIRLKGSKRGKDYLLEDSDFCDDPGSILEGTGDDDGLE